MGGLQPYRGRNRLAFLRGFLRDPERVASLVPSSRYLERRIVQTARLGDVRTVVELGPGTGGTTRALLQALPPQAVLLAVELSPQFVALLREIPDPRLIVQLGSAQDIARLLALHGLDRPEAVVSGIPFSTMPPALGREVFGAVWSMLAPGGRFVAYQFRDQVARIGRELCGEPEVAVELLNVPPMRIYRWTKPSTG